jgi:hypothetical protein
MPAQSRRPTNRPTRAQRRAGVPATHTRTYAVPAGRALPPRRSFAAEPPPVDHTEEFSFIRKDLVRIMLWAAVVLAIMIVLAFVRPYIF